MLAGRIMGQEASIIYAKASTFSAPVKRLSDGLQKFQ